LANLSARFDLAYADGASGPPSLAAKFPAADPTSRSTAAMLRLYEKEVGFYRDIAPHVGIRTPQIHFAEYDSASGDFLLLMEDCGPAEQGDQLAGCNAEQAEHCVEQIAALHGPSFGNDALTSLPFLETSDEVRSFTATAYVGAAEAFCTKYAGAIDPAFLEIVKATADKSNVLWERSQDDQIRSIIHGDFRLDNILFAIRGGAEPMVMLDWQTVVAGNPLTDLGYFMGAGIGSELRAQHGSTLLDCYAAALAKHGGPQLADIAQTEGYAHGALHGVTTAVFSAAFVEDNDRARAIFQSMAEGSCSLVQEIDALRILER
jgi:hypothetical protein